MRGFTGGLLFLWMLGVIIDALLTQNVPSNSTSVGNSINTLLTEQIVTQGGKFEFGTLIPNAADFLFNAFSWNFSFLNLPFTNFLRFFLLGSSIIGLFEFFRGLGTLASIVIAGAGGILGIIGLFS